MSEARLSIDLDALAHNYGVLKAASGDAEVAPVAKADGYGLGAGPVCRRLWAEGARRFFVARLSEGEALRRALGERDAQILILDGAIEGTLERLKDARLTPVLNSVGQALAWDGPPPALHVDTGMNRLGVSLAEADTLRAGGFRPGLVMSHLANAADPQDRRNSDQRAQFEVAHRYFPAARASLAASAGIWLGTDYAFDITRPGISLYGGGPREAPHPDFQAVATLEAPILQLRDLKAGERVGYGSMFTAERAMRIAVLGGGYADGVLRRTHARGYGWLQGVRTPFAIVSMDLIAVDVSACPKARVGDFVELLGPNALLDDMANAAGSVAHECLVRLSARAKRAYIGAV